MRQFLTGVMLCVVLCGSAVSAQAQTARFYGDEGYTRDDGRVRFPAYALRAENYVKVPLSKSGNIKEYRYSPRAYNCRSSSRAVRTTQQDSTLFTKDLGFKGFDEQQAVDVSAQQRRPVNAYGYSACDYGYTIVLRPTSHRQRGYFYGRQ